MNVLRHLPKLCMLLPCSWSENCSASRFSADMSLVWVQWIRRCERELLDGRCVYFCSGETNHRTSVNIQILSQPVDELRSRRRIVFPGRAPQLAALPFPSPEPTVGGCSAFGSWYCRRGWGCWTKHSQWELRGRGRGDGLQRGWEPGSRNGGSEGGTKGRAGEGRMRALVSTGDGGRNGDGEKCCGVQPRWHSQNV